MKVILLAAALLMLGAAAEPAKKVAADDAALAAAIDGRIAGKTSFCVDQSRLSGPQVINDRTILYRQSGKRIWISRLTDDCPWLNGDPILIVETYGVQLCRHDRFQVQPRSSPIASAYCFFGDFTPYDRPSNP